MGDVKIYGSDIYQGIRVADFENGSAYISVRVARMEPQVYIGGGDNGCTRPVHGGVDHLMRASARHGPFVDMGLLNTSQKSLVLKVIKKSKRGRFATMTVKLDYRSRVRND